MINTSIQYCIASQKPKKSLFNVALLPRSQRNLDSILARYNTIICLDEVGASLQNPTASIGLLCTTLEHTYLFFAHGKLVTSCGKTKMSRYHQNWCRLDQMTHWNSLRMREALPSFFCSHKFRPPSKTSAISSLLICCRGLVNNR
jgi:hypothetical protein